MWVNFEVLLFISKIADDSSGSAKTNPDIAVLISEVPVLNSERIKLIQKLQFLFSKLPRLILKV